MAYTSQVQLQNEVFLVLPDNLPSIQENRSHEKLFNPGSSAVY